MGLGISPFNMMGCMGASGSGAGMADINALVYGCRGLKNSSLLGAISSTRSSMSEINDCAVHRFEPAKVFLRSEASKSPAEADKRFDRSEGRGNGNTGSAFDAFPVIVGQKGAGRKKCSESRLTGTVQGTK